MPRGGSTCGPGRALGPQLAPLRTWTRLPGARQALDVDARRRGPGTRGVGARRADLDALARRSTFAARIDVRTVDALSDLSSPRCGPGRAYQALYALDVDGSTARSRCSTRARRSTCGPGRYPSGTALPGVGNKAERHS